MEHRETSHPLLRPAPGRVWPIWAILALPLVLLASLGFWSTLTARQSDNASTGTQSPASQAPVGEIHALARLEPASGVIVVGARPGARIERIQVGQGDLIVPGQVLALLEGHDLAQAQLALAVAQKSQAVHHRAVQKQKLALEREQFDKLQKIKLDAAPRVAFLTNPRFDENTKLFKTLEATLQGKDRIEAEMRLFESEVRNIKAKLDKDSLEIAPEFLRHQRKLEDDELGDSSPDLVVLDRQIDLARVSLVQAEVRAPISGRILELLAHAGEVSTGPLLQMGDPAAMVATAEVYQSDVPRLRLGDPASVQILDRTVTGTVTKVGAIVGKNQLANLDPRALQDRRVVKVKISLDDPTLASTLINMEVDAAIRPGGAGAQTASPRAAGG